MTLGSGLDPQVASPPGAVVFPSVKWVCRWAPSQLLEEDLRRCGCVSACVSPRGGALVVPARAEPVAVALAAGQGGGRQPIPLPGVPASPATLVPLPCVRDRDVNSSSMNTGSSRALLREGAGSLGAPIRQPDPLARASPCSLISLTLVHAFAEPRLLCAEACLLLMPRLQRVHQRPRPDAVRTRSRLASSASARR